MGSAVERLGKACKQSIASHHKVFLQVVRSDGGCLPHRVKMMKCVGRSNWGGQRTHWFGDGSVFALRETHRRGILSTK